MSPALLLVAEASALPVPLAVADVAVADSSGVEVGNVDPAALISNGSDWA